VSATQHMKKYKSHLIFLGGLLVLAVLLHFLGQVILPFVIGLILAFAVNPLVKRFQKVIPNRNLAVTVFLVSTTVLLVGSSVLFGGQVVKDFKRLNNAFAIFVDDNHENIDETARTVKEYIAKIYPSQTKLDSAEVNMRSQLDSLAVDSETLEKSFANITSFVGSEGDDQGGPRKVNWFLVLLYSIGYFLVIMYSFPYFESRFTKYFGGERQSHQLFDQLLTEFKQTFLRYFRQRSKVVVISSIIFIAAFLIIGIPGAIIIGILAGLLCYISHFQYLALLPLALSCWALSMEQDQSFFLYFGLVFATVVLVSVLEELLFFPKIMKDVATMNPAIMMISLAVWSALFGTAGFLIAIPLTTVLLSYLDKLLLYRKAHLGDGD
jgi:predicted PurR-regulated permease PerM